MQIIFVTEDRELAKGTKSHMGGQRDTTFHDCLTKEGVPQSQTVPIEFLDVRDGGAFADNLTWITAMIARECNCQSFVFWNVGTSFLLSGGSVAELFDINKLNENVVTDMEVQTRNTVMNLKHKFVLVPLVFNKETCDQDFLELEKDRAIGNIPVVGQSFPKFMEYNHKVAKDVKKSYPESYKQILDLNKLLAVTTLKSVNKVYGKEYHTVKYHLCEGNNQKNDKMMNNKDRQDYFVLLIKWVKNNYERETRKEMILKQVPAKKIALRLTQYYNS